MEKLKKGLLTADPCAPIEAEAEAEALDTWVSALPPAEVTAVDAALMLVIVTTLPAGADAALLFVAPVSADAVLRTGALLVALADGTLLVGAALTVVDGAALTVVVGAALTVVGADVDVDTALADDADAVSPAEADDAVLPAFPPQPASPSAASRASAGNTVRYRRIPNIIRIIVLPLSSVGSPSLLRAGILVPRGLARVQEGGHGAVAKDQESCRDRK